MFDLAAFEHNSMKFRIIQIRRANSEDLTLNQSFLQDQILTIDPTNQRAGFRSPSGLIKFLVLCFNSNK